MQQYSSLNITEITQLIRQKTSNILKHSIPKDRLLKILLDTEHSVVEDYADTCNTRNRLQTFLDKNCVSLASQIPCNGQNKGKCTIYPCAEGRHSDCYLAAASFII